MAESLREKWDEFREDFARTKHGYRQPALHRLTRFEKDYGLQGKYRRLEPDVDKSAGSECLDD